MSLGDGEEGAMTEGVVVVTGVTKESRGERECCLNTFMFFFIDSDKLYVDLLRFFPIDGTVVGGTT